MAMDSKEFTDRITRALENAKEAIEGIEEKERMRFRGNIIANVIIAYNHDGSIDAELRLESIPNDLSVNKLFTAVERHLRSVEGAFWQAGQRYEPREDEPIYNKFGGMSQAESWYHRSLTNALATGKKIDSNMRQHGRRKPKQVFVRAYWSPGGEHPKDRFRK